MKLEERVDEQFSLNPDLRVLFFFDSERRKQEEIEAWDHPSIRCEVVERPGFSLKYRLEHEWADEQVFLYFPGKQPRTLDGFALADVLVANRVLRIDEKAEFMSKFGLDERHRTIVETFYDRDLRFKNRQEVLASILNPGKFTKSNIQEGLAAYYLSATRFKMVPTEDELLAGIFIEAMQPESFNEYAERASKHQFSEYLGNLFAKRFDLDDLTFSREQVKRSAERLKYNLLCRSITHVEAEDPYRERLAIDNPITVNQLAGIHQRWNNSSYFGVSFSEAMRDLAPGVDEEKIVEAYGLDADYGYVSPAIQKARISEAVKHIKQNPSRANKQCAGQPAQASDGALSALSGLIEYMASYYQILGGYRTLDWSSPEQFLREYTSELHLCDRYYRRAVAAYNAIQQDYPNRVEPIAEAYDELLADYDDNFVAPLNVAWQRCFESAIQDDKPYPQDRLDSFYERHLKDTQKTAVIISDGFRYEAVDELKERIQHQKRSEAHLGAMLSPLPSITKLGKASLLPHKSLGFKDGLFTADGERTSDLDERTAILSSVNGGATAINYDQIKSMRSRKGRELFKEYPLIYIYHDRIDAAGDKRSTERDTFDEVDKTLNELSNLIKRLHSFNVYRVIVTADHGFLYSEKDLPPSQQERFPDLPDENVMLRKSRAIVTTDAEEVPGYRFPLRSVSHIDEDWTVVVPRAVNRYRLQGSGKQYAHGGASLQEMVVPVLEVLKNRTDQSEKVSVRLMSKTDTITSGLLKVKVLQENSTSNSVLPRTILVGLYDDQGSLISEEVEVRLDSSSSSVEVRTHDIVLSLLQEGNSLNACQLRIYDREDTSKLNPVVEKRFVIRRLFEQDDF